VKTETLENIYDCLTPERRKRVAQRTMELILDVVAEQMLEQECPDELAKCASIKAIMGVLKDWQDCQQDEQCAEQILAAIERMR